MRHTLSAFFAFSIHVMALIAVLVSTSGGWLKAASPVAAQTTQTPVKMFLPMVASANVPVSTLEKIEQALKAGQIDYPTSLLYRAYAQFGDARLPLAYRGNAVEEDSSLFREYTAANLPANIKTLLDPFMVRPEVSTSAWSVYAAAHPASAGSGYATPQQSIAALSITCIPNSHWAAVTSSAPGVSAKVWATCDGTYETDLLTVLGMINALWGPETALMGLPIADQNGGGPEIDIYLVNPLDSDWTGRVHSVPGYAVGVTYPTPPLNDTTSSGYILLPRALVYQADTKDTVAHEFFHVLQMAHNNAVVTPDNLNWWFTEASAEWAGAYFVPEISNLDYQNYTQYNKDDYQDSQLSLNVSGWPGTEPWLHEYQAFIWPYFMTQELGAKSIADVWRGVELGSSSVPPGAADADKVIDRILPFKDNFYRFGVRNLNFDLTPGSPINPRFIGQDPKFPDMIEPPMLNKGPDESLQATPLSDPGKTFSYNLPGLLAVYYHFVAPPAIQQVQIKPLIAATSPVRLVLLVKARGGSWSLRDLSGLTKVKLCNIEELYMVASNSDLHPGVTTQSSFNIHAVDLPCTCTEFANVPAVSGTVSFSYQHTASNATDRFQLDERGSPQFSLPLLSSGPGGVDFWSNTETGTGSIHNVYTDLSATPPAVYKTDGDGPAIKPDSLDNPMANLNINFLNCTYNFNASIYLNMTATDNNGATSSIQGLVGGVHSDNYPLIITSPVTTLSGGTSFPAHSITWGYTNSGNVYIPAMEGINMFLYGTATEENAGSASVTWSFSAPIPSP